MKLPFSDEIREARARSEASHAAELDRMRLEVALLEIDQLLEAPGLPRDLDLPGIELVPSDIPLDLPLRQRLQHHRVLVRHRFAEVAALAATAVADAEALHDLQHQQNHELSDPIYADICAELRQFGTARDEASLARMSVEHGRASVQMLAGLVGGAVVPLTLARTHDDPEGVEARAAALQARTHLFQIGDAFASVELTVQMPVVPTPPDAPHPRHRERLWAEVDSVLLWLRALHEELLIHEDRLAARVAELDEVIGTNEHELKEWMG